MKGGEYVSEHETKQRRDYSCYDSMSTAELEQLLCLDFQASEEATSDLDAILYISDLLAKRAEPADVDAAWEQLQTQYLPYADGRSLYDFGEEDDAPSLAPPQVPLGSHQRVRQPRVPGLKRAAVLAALLAACLFGGMVAVQAAGLDVFGAMARWTDETFHFAPTSVSPSSDGQLSSTTEDSPYAAMREIASSLGLDGSLVPTWCPDGFYSSGTNTIHTELGDTIYDTFYDQSDRFFNVEITRYRSEDYIQAAQFEKDDTPVETYSNGRQTFYILSNLDTITAVWSDGPVLEQINGTISREEFKQIIASIQGPEA